MAEGEPPGRWGGRGAEALGLTGLVDGQDMTALYEHFVDPRDEAFKDPSKWAEASKLGHSGRLYASAEELYAKALNAEPYASPERREQLRLDAAKKARTNVAFLDVTFSVQKSVTVLHAAFEAQEVTARKAGDEVAEAAWAAHREAVEEAIWAGNNAALDYLAEKAGYARVGHHGGSAGRFVDAHDWIHASFFQHDNRDRDPQLHVHNAILNRVQGADGKWRTLDSRAIHSRVKVAPASMPGRAQAGTGRFPAPISSTASHSSSIDSGHAATGRPNTGDDTDWNPPPGMGTVPPANHRHVAVTPSRNHVSP